MELKIVFKGKKRNVKRKNSVPSYSIKSGYALMDKSNQKTWTRTRRQRTE